MKRLNCTVLRSLSFLLIKRLTKEGYFSNFGHKFLAVHGKDASCCLVCIFKFQKNRDLKMNFQHFYDKTLFQTLFSPPLNYKDIEKCEAYACGISNSRTFFYLYRGCELIHVIASGHAFLREVTSDLLVGLFVIREELVICTWPVSNAHD